MADEQKINTTADKDINFPPAETCVVCDKPFSAIGGRRLYATHFLGIYLTREPKTSNSAEIGCIEIPNLDGLLLQYRGSEAFWNDNVLSRAISQAEAGTHPWFCQCCGGYGCKECGAPLFYPPGADIINDEGKKLHCAVFPVPRKCINPECSNYKTPG